MPEGIITHLSYSQISTYLTCPLRYNFQYVQLIPAAFKTASLVFGSAIHEAVAAYYQMKLEADDLKPDQMLDVYRQTWKQAEDVKFYNGDNEESLLLKTKQLIDVFHTMVDQDATVLGVEEFFEIQLAKELPPFHGYIDLIQQDSNGQITIADLKTSAKKPADNAVHSNMQLTAYSLGATALGFDPNQLLLRLDVLTKTKNPEMFKYETARTDADRDRFIKLVRSVWSAIENHVFYPKEDWHCSQCAWADCCKEW